MKIPVSKATLTIERLKEVLSYDPESGVFTWLQGGRGWMAGSRAGSKAERGYRRVGVDFTDYREHRLAWFYMTGRWPTHEVDHINGDRSDNRWANLREATDAVNSENQRQARRDSKVGLLGVSIGQAGRYRAVIQVKGKTTFLGEYATPELAHAAYVSAKRQLHEGCTL